MKKCADRASGVFVASVLVLALVGGLPAAATEYVVDQKHAAASDGNPGTAAAPFETISHGVSAARPGDTVLVKSGAYRETVTFANSGTADARITLRAAPGERVVVNGAEEVTGWRPCTPEEARGNANFRKLYVAETDKMPAALFQDGHPLKRSRWPARSRYPAQGGSNMTVVDAEHLTQPAGFWEGGTLTVRVARIGSYRKSLITGYDPAKHELTVAQKVRDDDIVPVKDSYCIDNLITIIDEPGEYACDTTVTPHRLYVWPEGNGDPNQCTFEVPRRRSCVSWGEGIGFITVLGIEAAFSTGSGFRPDGRGSHDLEAVSCISHDHQRAGFSFSRQKGIAVRNCISARNSYGIMFSYCTDGVVEGNGIYSNSVDGLVISWQSGNFRIVRNCIVDHWGGSHPDGFQVYRGANNLYVDSNLIFNPGQGYMAEETDTSTWVNNMIIFAHHTGLLLGHRSSDNYTLINNTIAYAGTRALVVDGKNARVRNNVLVAGADGKLVVAYGNRQWDSDYNLYWMPEDGTTIRREAQDAHSKWADPRFRSAPPLAGRSCYVIDQWSPEAKGNSKGGKFYLIVKANDHFRVGDFVEVNCDGVRRTVTEVTDRYVAFEPALKMLHEWEWDMLVNWKDQEDFVWDLRLADDSPGKGMGEGGKDVGSSIDIQAYLRGDFDGDGKRDLPDAPRSWWPEPARPLAYD
jgi:hypothetical protein